MQAMEAMNERPFQGRILHVVPAKEPPKDALAELDPSQARTYKVRRLAHPWSLHATVGLIPMSKHHVSRCSYDAMSSLIPIVANHPISHADSGLGCRSGRRSSGGSGQGTTGGGTRASCAVRPWWTPWRTAWASTRVRTDSMLCDILCLVHCLEKHHITHVHIRFGDVAERDLWAFMCGRRRAGP